MDNNSTSIYEVALRLGDTQVKYVIKSHVDQYGMAVIGSNIPYIISVGIGYINNQEFKLYVNRFFQNEYQIWYAEIYKDEKVFTDTSVEFNLIYIRNNT